MNVVSTQEAGKEAPRSATINACKLCSPLGAAMVFKGIRNCLPFLHGSQGCATYIRRYMISHFREPVDIASSSFSEDDAIFGGARNFALGVENVISQYEPEMIGVATTCLSETIGDNMLGMIRDYQIKHSADGPPLVNVSTPAYSGTHSEGFHATVLAVVEHLVEGGEVEKVAGKVNLFPGMVSCADLRHLKELFKAYDLKPSLLPDYSETLEGDSWNDYHRISPGGTGIEEIRAMNSSIATVELGHCLLDSKVTAGGKLEQACDIPNHVLGMPIGIRLSDKFFDVLEKISGKERPAELVRERSRLVDAYVDAHKYTSAKKIMIFGEPDLVSSLTAFASEIGLNVVVAATGSKPRGYKRTVENLLTDELSQPRVLTGADHAAIREAALETKPDIILGSSKGFPMAKELNIPLIRVGFPIHDRFGAQRQLLLGYKGSQEIFDRVVNALMAAKQSGNDIGYSYI